MKLCEPDARRWQWDKRRQRPNAISDRVVQCFVQPTHRNSHIAHGADVTF